MNRQTVSLDVIEVKQPCPASWGSMRGDDRMRFCEGCRRHVQNLSAMTRAEAEQLLEGCPPDTRLCVRFGRLADGTVQTLDYQFSQGSRGRGWRFWTALGACMAGGVAAVNAYVFRNSLPPPFARPQPNMVMGMMPPPPFTTAPEIPPVSEPSRPDRPQS